MNVKRNLEIKNAFTISSTDELHHCENRFVYVDKVALSTNRFYMINSLDLGRTLSRRQLEQMVALKDKPGSVFGLKEASFVSFYSHCMSHLKQPKILRAIYLLKAMGKTLNEKKIGDYFDVLDPHLAYAYEMVAYSGQTTRWEHLNVRIPEELGEAILECIDKDKEEVDADAEKCGNLIRKSELSLFESHHSNGYSQFLSGVVIPAIAILVSLDETELLSQFSFGIVSLFENLPPQIYFTEDTDTLDGKRVGHCPMPEIKDRHPWIEDMVIIPSKEIWEAVSSTPSQNPNFNASQFLHNNYFDKSKEYSTGWMHQIALSQLWREAIQNLCPCSFTRNYMADCPYLSELYQRIRNFFLMNPHERLGVCRRYVKKLERKSKKRISPWNDKIYILRKDKDINKLSAYVS